MKDYRFIGNNHFVKGEPLAKGAVVSLTDDEFRSFGREKFRPISEEADGAADASIEQASELAQSLVAAGQKDADFLRQEARKDRDAAAAELNAATEEATSIVADARATAERMVADATQAVAEIRAAAVVPDAPKTEPVVTQ